MDFEDFLKMDASKMAGVSGMMSIICGDEVKQHMKGSTKEMRKMMLSKMGETYAGMSWEEFLKFMDNSYLFDFRKIFKGRLKKKDETTELRVWSEQNSGALILASGMDELDDLIIHIQVESPDPLGFPWSGGPIDESAEIRHLHMSAQDGLSYWLVKASLQAKPVLPWRSGKETPWCYVPGFKRPMDIQLFDLIFSNSDRERDIYDVIRKNRGEEDATRSDGREDG